ncbi:bifunctional polymyxin resistance protein, ArnA [Artemisia annua]|uniref:Bifunctional polymyxin resistance protein, ArnA n=1 Tax=Artemisia annua TaxID=35608 RepID=A0A2U1NY36_ARTAN|nr:bifunctional polymyxin resistance protein, ArnA [Artemisia annua]
MQAINNTTSVNLAAICTPADYNTRPLDTIYSNFIDALPVVKYCSENNKRLIHFSTCEVYGKTIGPAYYILKEDTSPCIFGSIDKQRWSYACAKQLIERLIYAEGAENGLEFTITQLMMEYMSTLQEEEKKLNADKEELEKQIYSDPKARNDTEYKLETFSGDYRKLSGKDVVFEYPMTEA